MAEKGQAARPREAKAAAELWAPAYAAILGGSQDAFARWVQGMLELSQEIAQFTQSRLQEDMTTWWKLATCHSPEEAGECQQRFATKAVEQYSEEITKLSQMMMKLATEGLSSVQPRKGDGN